MSDHRKHFVPPAMERKIQGTDLIDQHQSLASLALAAHERVVEERRQADEARAAKAQELRDQFMTRWLSNRQQAASSALARKLGISSDHDVINAIRWHLKPEEWNEITFTENDEGTIHATGTSKVHLWTELDGMPLSASYQRYDSGEQSFHFSSHPSSGVTSGFVDLVALGADIARFKKDQEAGR